jgi:hypothetical protein
MTALLQHGRRRITRVQSKRNERTYGQHCVVALSSRQSRSSTQLLRQQVTSTAAQGGNCSESPGDETTAEKVWGA